MRRFQAIRIPRYHNDGVEPKPWVLDENFKYFSERYGKWVFLPEGYRSDGATGAFDIISAAWWVHAKLCEDMAWEDGSPATRWQGSRVCSDSLDAEGRQFRSFTWKYATYRPSVWHRFKGLR